jgi:hypothetical protein
MNAILVRGVGATTRRFAAIARVAEAPNSTVTRHAPTMRHHSRHTLPSTWLLHSQQHSQRRLLSTGAPPAAPPAAPWLEDDDDEGDRLYDETAGPRKFTPEERAAYKAERKARLAAQKVEKKVCAQGAPRERHTYIFNTYIHT